jgi:hypothetical protein
MDSLSPFPETFPRAAAAPPSTPGIALALNALGILCILAGGFLVIAAGASEHAGSEAVPIGISTAVAGVLVLGFAFAVTKLHQIELHLRDRSQ